MTNRTVRSAKTPRPVREAQPKYVILPRSEYAHLRRYKNRSRYVLDALDFVAWSIGHDLCRLRRKAGLSQAQVARRAGIRVETLSRLENGHGNPTVKTVQKILRAFSSRESVSKIGRAHV